MSDNGNPEAVEESERKKLRSSEEDLKIIVRAPAKKDDDKSAAEKEYHFHSVVMAKHSHLVDISLSTDMREKCTKTIIFQDVCPEVFERALGYLEHPYEARMATVANILEVLSFYDKYEFTEGLLFSNRVITDYFQQRIESPKPPESLDIFVEALCGAHQYNMKEALSLGRAFLNICLRDTSQTRTIQPQMFQEKHFAELQPLFQDGSLGLPIRVEASSEEISSALFSKYCVKCLQENRCQLKEFRLKFELQNEIEPGHMTAYHSNLGKAWISSNYNQYYSSINISGEFYNVTVQKIPITTERGALRNYGLSIAGGLSMQGLGDWAIYLLEYEMSSGDADEAYAVFYSPFSAHTNLPPKGPWCPVGRYSDLETGLGCPTLSGFEYKEK